MKIHDLLKLRLAPHPSIHRLRRHSGTGGEFSFGVGSERGASTRSPSDCEAIVSRGEGRVVSRVVPDLFV